MSTPSGGIGDIFPSPTDGRAPPGGSTVPNIFPSETDRRGGGGPVGAGSNGVYYLVFLGVLLSLIILAAALTYRSYRIRRRYRTATQLAIARGDPIPPGMGWWGQDDDLWGLGVLRGAPGPMDRWAAVGRQRRERRWMPIPVLYDAVPEEEVVEEKGKGVGGDLWDDILPLTVHSLLPQPTTPSHPRPAPQPPPTPSLSASERLRHASVGFRRRMRLEAPPTPPPQTSPSAPAPVAELKQALVNGEPVRVVVIVQMPGVECGSSALSDEDDVGWRPGMEIGVWEGTVEGGAEEEEEAAAVRPLDNTAMFEATGNARNKYDPAQAPRDAFAHVRYHHHEPQSQSQTESDYRLNPYQSAHRVRHRHNTSPRDSCAQPAPIPATPLPAPLEPAYDPAAQRVPQSYAHANESTTSKLTLDVGILGTPTSAKSSALPASASTAHSAPGSRFAARNHPLGPEVSISEHEVHERSRDDVESRR